MQQESLGHMAVQKWIREQNPDLNKVFSIDFIKAVHEQFYINIPEKRWEIKNKQGEVVTTVEPGAWRDRDVEIGRHVPPIAGAISELMRGFCDTYNPNKYRGDRKLVAIMAPIIVSYSNTPLPCGLCILLHCLSR